MSIKSGKITKTLNDSSSGSSLKDISYDKETTIGNKKEKPVTICIACMK